MSTINEHRARHGLPPVEGGDRLRGPGVFNQEIPLEDWMGRLYSEIPFFRPPEPERKTLYQRAAQCGAVIDLNPRTGRPARIVVSRVWRTGRDAQRVIEWPHPVFR